MLNNLNDLKLIAIHIKINHYIEEIRLDEEMDNR